MRILFVFEFNVPSYRFFIIEKLSNDGFEIESVSADDKFDHQVPWNNKIALKISGKGENKLYFFSPKSILFSDVIVSTFNIRRPHTWMYILLFPWKKWVLWGQAEWTSNNFFVNILRRLVFRISSGYIAYTPSGKSNLVKFGYPENNISVAYNTLQVSNSRMTYGSRYLLYVGRIQERKRVEAVFPFLKALNIKLRIVGDGDYRSKLDEEIERYEVQDYVELFPSTYDDDQLLQHFSGAIAYFSPGHVGLGVVHAFSYGVPVVTLERESHAPEFEYCSLDNSYIFSDFDTMIEGLEHLDPLSCTHMDKKRKSLEFFKENLSEDKFLEAFLYHFQKFEMI